MIGRHGFAPSQFQFRHDCTLVLVEIEEKFTVCDIILVLTGPVTVGWLCQTQKIDPVVVILSLVTIPVLYDHESVGQKENEEKEQEV